MLWLQRWIFSARMTPQEVLESAGEASISQVGLKGAFTRQSKNGTDPTKTGTVQTVFAKKQWTFNRSATDP